MNNQRVAVMIACAEVVKVFAQSSGLHLTRPLEYKMWFQVGRLLGAIDAANPDYDAIHDGRDEFKRDLTHS